MKSIQLPLLVIVFSFCAYTVAFAQKAPQKVNNTQPAVKLNGKTDSVQYTLGAYIGLFIVNNHFPMNTASPMFLKGLEDILQNKARPFPDSMIASNLLRYQETFQRGKAQQEEQQLFASLNGKTGVGMFPNGVRYVVLQAGKGPRVSSEKDSITIHLQAKLPDGTVVEDTYQAQKPFEATASSFFPGLTEALQMMNEGSKWQVFVPAALAYGEQGTGMIPPNSALVIEVELLRIRKK